VVTATRVPSLRVLVGGLEPRCRSCNGVLLVGESVACRECRTALRGRALIRLTVATPHPSPVSVA
jgi:hypothetical protein